MGSRPGGWLGRGLTVNWEQKMEQPAVAMACDVLEMAVAAAGYPVHRMVSGAGHDAMRVAPFVPAAMLFVPSRRGISHSPEEWTETADCELGARVLAGTLRRLAS